MTDFKGVRDAIIGMMDEYVGFWTDVCNIESPSNDKSGVDRVGAYFAERAAARGWQVEYHREKVSGDVVVITVNPSLDTPPVVFSGHMDTVHPKGAFGYPPVRIKDGRIYGPGVCDCKGGIVAAFMAMAALDAVGFKERPIKLILQSDEEISSASSSKRTVDYMASCAEGAIAFLNTEPFREGQLTIERKGIIRYIFKVSGMAVHSSLCFAGASAIAEAAHKIIELEKWKSEDGITCNCGVISGGTVANTVAERCEFTADIRYSTDEELELIEAEIRRIADTSYVGGTVCEAVEKSRRICMPQREENKRLAERVSNIFECAGLPSVKFHKSKGGSDASDISARGIPTLDSFGVRGAYIHSPLEYAEIESLAESALRLASVAYYL